MLDFDVLRPSLCRHRGTGVLRLGQRCGSPVRPDGCCELATCFEATNCNFPKCDVRSDLLDLTSLFF